MRIVVAAHGHCFDGLASAAIFTRFARTILDEDSTFAYRACGYGPSQACRAETVLDGDVNALLDYRYVASEHLTWFFDHHRTAFQSAADREHFEGRRPGGRFYFDPMYTSCTKLISDIARSDFDQEFPELAELVRWADVVDSAQFDSAEAAIDSSNPILQLVTVVEHHGGDAFYAQLVPQLLGRPLLEVARQKEIQRRFSPLGKKHERFVRRVSQAGQKQGRVVLVDLTDEPVDLVGKFVTYALFPNCTYSVLVARLKSAVKISVGYNPWSGQPLDTDISAICARHGGGGHPVVGGISLKLDAVAEARDVASSIAAELDGATP